MAVLVLGKTGNPLMPCSEKRARKLMEASRAVVHRKHPFTIRLRDRVDGDQQPLMLKFDPGASATGVALVRVAADGTQHVLLLMEIEHRGGVVKMYMARRASLRGRRRSENLRYRKKRGKNRKVPEGKLPPSLNSRVDNLSNWTNRMRRSAPVSQVAVEQVRFDSQKLQNPEIHGVEYQQGTLFEYEVREYLFEKWGRKCVYCDAEDVPLTKDHIYPSSRGGSNRVSNLAPACKPCNEKKSNTLIQDFLAHDPERLERIQKQQNQSLASAAVVNITRKRVVQMLRDTGLPVETGTGGQTKWNRHRLHVPKTHALDAACAGQVDQLANWQCPTLIIKAMGRGNYRRTLPDAHGFPRSYLPRTKRAHGFQTGDRVEVNVPKGKYTGRHVGRVMIRHKGAFKITTASGDIEANWRYCRLISRNDGYDYAIRRSVSATVIGS